MGFRRWCLSVALRTTDSGLSWVNQLNQKQINWTQRCIQEGRVRSTKLVRCSFLYFPVFTARCVESFFRLNLSSKLEVASGNGRVVSCNPKTSKIPNWNRGLRDMIFWLPWRCRMIFLVNSKNQECVLTLSSDRCVVGDFKFLWLMLLMLSDQQRGRKPPPTPSLKGLGPKGHFQF